MYILVLTLTQSLVFILTELGSSSKRASSHPLTILNSWHKNAMTGLALNCTNSKILNFAPVSRSSPCITLQLPTVVTFQLVHPLLSVFPVSLPHFSVSGPCTFQANYLHLKFCLRLIFQGNQSKSKTLGVWVWVCECEICVLYPGICILGLFCNTRTLCRHLTFLPLCSSSQRSSHRFQKLVQGNSIVLERGNFVYRMD